jgi:hypothetical protein
MRSTSDTSTARLYHLDPDSGAATTIVYGSLAEVLRAAEAEPAEVQDGLFVQTDNDVVAYLDLVGG